MDMRGQLQAIRPEIDAAVAPRAVATPTSPALQARNHAATPAE